MKDSINNVDWSVYGKINNIAKNSGNISYTYDPSGNRVTKTANGIKTYYVRDAQGNSLAVYDNAGNTNNWREQQLYGSSRLGMWKPNINLATANGDNIWNSYGLKFFELSNHLGNVMDVVSDNRLQSGSTYEPDVINANDYYAFGGQMPGRSFTLEGSSAYRYGFNGKENDNEVKGQGNQQDYGMRIYDPRIAKFLSVDPISNEYPELTPYQFASNRPIDGIDQDGLEYAESGAHAYRLIREEKARLTKIDPRLAKEYEDKGNVIGITFVGSALTMGYGVNVWATLGYRALLTNMAKGAVIGAGVNSIISYSKGDSGYEILKSATSGFFSGAVMGIGSGGSIGGFLATGANSGILGEIVSQEFDNRFGGTRGYDLEKIAISGGVGAVANTLSNAIVGKITKMIESKLAASLAETNTAGYRNTIKKAILERTPRIGERALNRSINATIKANQSGLSKEASAAKVGLQQAIERGLDYLSDKYNDHLKNK
ncbi:RHS repeat-associated core domain-containing protein [Pedobacter miscanthi]|uniref:RHS repeat domain-containing protein n=1 Tax=Pedobacter miscanthi TaxID=2259170 RepID=UPI00292E2455|nr:RHS repeat-associated core domain-containing protein [Pedobacter miscanthi]